MPERMSTVDPLLPNAVPTAAAPPIIAERNKKVTATGKKLPRARQHTKSPDTQKSNAATDSYSSNVPVQLLLRARRLISDLRLQVHQLHEQQQHRRGLAGWHGALHCRKEGRLLLKHLAAAGASASWWQVHSTCALGVRQHHGVQSIVRQRPNLYSKAHQVRVRCTQCPLIEARMVRSHQLPACSRGSRLTSSMSLVLTAGRLCCILWERSVGGGVASRLLGSMGSCRLPAVPLLAGASGGSGLLAVGMLSADCRLTAGLSFTPCSCFSTDPAGTM